MPHQESISRRKFMKVSAVAASALPLLSHAQSTPPKLNIKLGYDNFAVRAMKWKAPQLIDYAAKLKTDSLFISDLDAFENTETNYLSDLRKEAAAKGFQIHLGTWSICPTSKTFRPARGTAEEHLGLALRMAKDLGSPVIRVILGNGEDRKTPGGIQARIKDTVNVCKALRSKALDLGVKIAVENHAGDLQARELVDLIEQAGPDYVGANLDSGNAVWTMEEPVHHLSILAPYVCTTSLRDSAIWESTNGATVQWTAMGDGNVDFKKFMVLFAEKCKGVPVHIETISGFNREIPFLQPGFWSAFPNMPASDLAQYVALAKKGKPRAAWKAPEGKDPAQSEQEHQKDEVERSIRYCKETLGLGLKPV